MSFLSSFLLLDFSEYKMHHKSAEHHEKTNRRRSLRQNGGMQPMRKYSLDFSRYLCDDATQTALINKRPSKSFSDSEAVSLKKHFQSNNGDAVTIRRTSIGQASIQRSPFQIHQRDDKFQRKYTATNEQAGGMLTSLPFANQRTNTSPIGPLDFDDECARSVCDSVSSVACSTLKNYDDEVEYRREKKHSMAEKVSKIDAIESWLQAISELPR